MAELDQLVEDENGLLVDAFRYGSVLVPTFDAWPSSAISFATFDPVGGEISISFKSGESASYDCSIPQWLGYKASASRGSYYNEHFKQQAAAAAAAKPAPKGIAKNPYPKRF